MTLYHIKTGDLTLTQMANSAKQAAMRFIGSHEKQLGKFIIVSLSEIVDCDANTQTFFSTQALMDERSENQMKITY